MEPLLSLRRVSFNAKNIRIIHNISLDFEAGATTALVGASGSGKSTLLKLCAGLLLPASGEIRYRGRDIAAMNHAQTLEFRRESAFVFQDSALWSNQSLYQNLELPLRIHYPQMPSAERMRRVADAAAEVGYRRDLSLRPAELSAGEQKLIGFARAMICAPKLLFLDEWTESLDDSAANRLITLVKRRQSDHTVIFISHKLEIIKSLAQFVILIVGGYAYLRLTAEQIRQDSDFAGMLERDIA